MFQKRERISENGISGFFWITSSTDIISDENAYQTFCKSLFHFCSQPVAGFRFENFPANVQANSCLSPIFDCVICDGDQSLVEPAPVLFITFAPPISEQFHQQSEIHRRTDGQ